MKIRHLSDKIIWFGKHTGYELLSDYLKQINNQIKSICLPHNLMLRGIGKLYSSYKKWPERNSISALSEFIFDLVTKNKDIIKHILYLEHHLIYMEKWKNKAPRNIIGTIHHPPIQWYEERIKFLKKLSSAIVLYKKDIKFFEKYVGKNRVKFIHHGCDTDFFKPKEDQYKNHVLSVGHHRRNFPMLIRIIKKLSKRYKNLIFDIVIPEKFKNPYFFKDLINNKSVIWHHKISDEKLLEFYQKSLILLIPINHSGANNSIIESLSCGLPIVTTDVGGVRDYGGGSIYPIVKNDDDDTMIKLVEKYLSDETYRNKISKKQREFAEQKLAWPIIAKKHLEVYKELIE